MRYEINVPVVFKMSMNDRLHWAKRNRITQNLRLTAKVGASKHQIGAQQERITVGLTWHVGTRHRRDSDNPMPMLKALCDGLVDAGVIVDDTPGYVLKEMPEISYVKGQDQRFTFWVQTFDQYGEDAA